MRAWNVGIVGGGPGGLMTAYSLQKQANCPVRISIFEGSSRLGGKILTPSFDSVPICYEAGAAEFYDYSRFEEDSLKDLIAELGLPISPMGGSAVIMDEQVISNVDDVRESLSESASKAFLEFDRRAKDRMTPQEFYYSDTPEGAYQQADTRRFDTLLAEIKQPETRNYVENMIRSDLATEPCQTSRAYGLQNYLMNDPAYMQLYGIVGGNERLPAELAARIEATIRLEHSVKNVAKQNSGQLRVTSEHGSITCEDDFDFVVVALPHNQLKSVSFSGESISAAVDEHFNYYHYPAHYLRITLLFETAFWRSTFTDSYWMLDKFGGCCLYDESSRQPGCNYGVLGWLLGGAVAEEMSLLSDEELFTAALDSLPSFMSRHRDQLLEGKVHRWIAAVNAMPGGVSPKNLDSRHQPDPVNHPNLFFVGDYMFDSTLNGVLDSAEYVAAWLAAKMS
jgi:protoporphyrinogen oxidase